MKKITLLCGIAALALASCSNDELVLDSTVDEAANVPIGFAVSTGNMSRAATDLSAQHWDFGVWAYKGSGATPSPTSAVMEKYLVGFWDTNLKGYKPKAGQSLAGSHYTPSPEAGTAWYYEGLGSTETSKYEFLAGGTSHTVSTSANEVQYLKYWDRGAAATWFYAYAPYTLSTGVTFDKANLKMVFPNLDVETGANAMYAAAKVETPAAATDYVNLTFYRMFSQVRFAFYEDVVGYDVRLYPYSDTYKIPTGDPNSSYEYNAMFAVPAVYDGTNYTAGEYVKSGAPEITFGETNYIKPSISYTTPTTTPDNLNIPILFYNPSHTETTLLGETKANAIKNDTKDVFPQSSTSTCGFTLNLSLKFIAKYTDEEILVRGVRVHIPAEHCRWLPNHLYTYYFKVTKNVPGAPGEPGTPSKDPGDDPYLWPIVYDNVTVEAFEDNEVKYPSDGLDDAYGI